MFTFLKQFFSYIFPPSCIVCTEHTKQVNLCDDCLEKLPLTREFPRPWIFSLYHYKNEQANKCIKHIKTYPDIPVIKKLITHKKLMLTGWLQGLAAYHSSPQIILIPVPIHYSRFLDRGYNQSELIAETILETLSLRKTSIIIHKNILKKKHATEKQALIANKKERLKNTLSPSFKIEFNNISPNSVVVIIDDVTTTGATLDAIREHLLTITPNIYAFTLSH